MPARRPVSAPRATPRGVGCPRSPCARRLSGAFAVCQLVSARPGATPATALRPPREPQCSEATGLLGCRASWCDVQVHIFVLPVKSNYKLFNSMFSCLSLSFPPFYITSHYFQLPFPRRPWTSPLYPSTPPPSTSSRQLAFPSGRGLHPLDAPVVTSFAQGPPVPSLTFYLRLHGGGGS